MNIELLSIYLYNNILLAYIFNVLILLLVSKKVVYQLWQIICSPIETCKLVLDIMIRLCYQKLYNNNFDYH